MKNGRNGDEKERKGRVAGGRKDDEAAGCQSVRGPARRLSGSPPRPVRPTDARLLGQLCPLPALQASTELSCAPSDCPFRFFIKLHCLIVSHLADLIIHHGLASPFACCSRFKTFYL